MWKATDIIAALITAIGMALLAMGVTYTSIYMWAGPPTKGLMTGVEVGGVVMAFETAVGFAITGAGFLLSAWLVFRKSDLEDQRKINFRLSETIATRARKDG